MCARRDVEGDLLEVHAHRLAVAAGHDDAGGFTFGGTDRAEQPRRGASLILGCRGPRAALRPAPGELGLLTDASLVLPPQLYRRSSREAPPDLRQARSEEHPSELQSLIRTAYAVFRLKKNTYIHIQPRNNKNPAD